MYDFKRIIELDEYYSKLLDGCSIAGEIVIDENELLQICKELKENSYYIRNGDLNNIFLIICVNIAYYYYDEFGFWQHFYNITNLNNKIITEGMVGQIIEKVLTDKNLIIYNRVGPFRYVGTILEQTGITRHNIDKFAFIIKDAIQKHGIKYLMNVTNYNYKKIVNNLNCSKFFRQYLLDMSGWNFFCYIIRTIFYLENRVLDIKNIAEFKGIQPMFWQEFLKYYNITYKDNLKENSDRLYYPNIMLDIINRKICIRFPYVKYTIIHNGIQIRSNGNTIYYITDENYLESNYIGTLWKDNTYYEWSLKGWDPKKNSCAYFNQRGQFIDNIENLHKGKFYIITNDIKKISIGNINKHIGKLNLGYIFDYDIYEVNIEIINNKFKKVFLKWENYQNILQINCSFDIFIEKVPKITIENIELLENKEEILLYDIGKGIKRIKDYYTFKDLLNDMNEYESVIGEIWSESINSRYKNRSSLKFCVIPKCKLELPYKYYSINDSVKFISDSKYIFYNNCKKINDTDWIFNHGELNIEGYININKYDLYFNFPIKIINLLINDKISNYCFVDDIDENNLIIIHASSNFSSKIKLILSYEHTKIELIENCCIENNYDINFSIIDIESAIFKLIPNFIFGKLFLEYEDEFIDLSFYLLNFTNLINNIETIISNEEKYNMLKSIDENITSKLKQIFSIYEQPIVSLLYINPNENCRKLDELYYSTLLLSIVFDKTISIDNKGNIIKIENYNNNNFTKTIKWYYKANEAIKNSDYNLSEILKLEFKDLIIPKLHRWNNEIYKLHDKLCNVNDNKSAIIEWSAEVNNMKKYKLKGYISSKEDGKKITCAWIEYLKGNYEYSMKIVGSIEIFSNIIVKELERMLKIIIYFKLIRFNAMKELIRNNDNNNNSIEIDAILKLYDVAYEIIFGNELKNKERYKNDLSLFINIFPLREEDKEILFFLNYIISLEKIEYIAINNPSNNWMKNFLCYKILKSNEKTKVLYKEKLINQINEIPESPEKIFILEQL